MHTEESAVSAVLSVMLLIIVVFVLGIVLFNFVVGMVGKMTDSNSAQPFSLVIENVNINDTCMTISVGNRLKQDVLLEKAYINDEPHEILNSPETIPSIPAESTGNVYVKGRYVPGGLYNIKLVFNSGQSVISVTRY